LTTAVFLDSHYQSGLEGIVGKRMFWLVGAAVLLSGHRQDTSSAGPHSWVNVNDALLSESNLG
jgi:hypothetical protein